MARPTLGCRFWEIFSPHFVWATSTDAVWNTASGETQGISGDEALENSAEITTSSHSEHTRANMQNRLHRVWYYTGWTKSCHCWHTFEQMGRFHTVESMANFPMEAAFGRKCAVNNPSLYSTLGFLQLHIGHSPHRQLQSKTNWSCWAWESAPSHSKSNHTKFQIIVLLLLRHKCWR